MCDVDRSKLQVSRRLIDGFDGILDASFENGDLFDDRARKNANRTKANTNVSEWSTEWNTWVKGKRKRFRVAGFNVTQLTEKNLLWKNKVDGRDVPFISPTLLCFFVMSSPGWAPRTQKSAGSFLFFLTFPQNFIFLIICLPLHSAFSRFPWLKDRVSCVLQSNSNIDWNQPSVTEVSRWKKSLGLRNTQSSSGRQGDEKKREGR